MRGEMFVSPRRFRHSLQSRKQHARSTEDILLQRGRKLKVTWLQKKNETKKNERKKSERSFTLQSRDSIPFVVIQFTPIFKPASSTIELERIQSDCCCCCQRENVWLRWFLHNRVQWSRGWSLHKVSVGWKQKRELLQLCMVIDEDL